MTSLIKFIIEKLRSISVFTISTSLFSVLLITLGHIIISSSIFYSIGFYSVIFENIIFYLLFVGSLYIVYLLYSKQTYLLHQANVQVKDALIATQKVMTLSSRRIELSDQLDEILLIILDLPFVRRQKQGAIFTFDPEKQRLIMTASYGLHPYVMTHCKEISLGHCLCGRAAKQKTSLFSSGIDETHDIYFEGMHPHGHYCLPITENEKLRGVLNLYTDEGHSFNESEHLFLESIGHAILGIFQRHDAETILLTYNAHLEERVVKGTLQLKHSYQIQTTINNILTISVSSTSFHNKIENMLNALFDVDWLSLERKGCLFLVNEKNPSVLDLVVSQGFTEELGLCKEIPFGLCLCGRCALEKKTIFKNHIDRDHDIPLSSVRDHGHYCLPLLNNDGELLGVINLYVAYNHPYHLEEEKFLNAVGHIFALTIERHQTQDRIIKQNANLQHNVDATVNAISHMGETRDPYTAGHQGRVAILAARIAENMGLSKKIIDTVYLSGILHDIGKIAIPAEILAKPGKLTPAEFQLIKEHSQTSYEILKGIPFETPIADIVHQHHEKPDGTGYPRGLSEYDILLEAKILAVADVFEALASHRPYRPSLGLEKATEVLENGRGTHFFSEAVDHCLAILKKCGSFEAIFDYSIKRSDSL